MISVIIPIYNEEAYLSRCIDSVLRSGCPDFELILVDDGSTDRSPEICRACCGRDGRIRCILQDHQGVSAARNRGIDASRGEWIVFVDADDLISRDFLGLIASQEERSLLLFDFTAPHRRPGGDRFPHAGEAAPPARALGREDVIPLLQSLLTLRPPFPGCRAYLRSPCAKAYRRSLINRHSIRFPPGVSIGEDALFNIQYLAQAESIAYFASPVYSAEKHLDSATHRFHGTYLQDDRQFERKLKALLLQQGLFPSLEAAYYENVLANMAAVLIRGIFSPHSPRSYRENCALCREMLADEIYRQALTYNGQTGVLPRRILLACLRRRRFLLVRLICRVSYWYLYVWKGL